MNENVDLVKILDGCPEGTKFYSPLFGDVEFICIIYNVTPPEAIGIEIRCFDETGWVSGAVLGRNGLYLGCYNGEIMLFPSREQRDWSKFERFWDKPKVERFDVCTFNHFDEVLFRIDPTHTWICGFVSHVIEDDFGKKLVYTNDGLRVHCIPFNEETKHLAGTTDDCPEYYKWWEE